jgi:hypothetical protein
MTKNSNCKLFNNLDETSPTIKQSDEIYVQLKSHQLTSVKAMLDLENGNATRAIGQSRMTRMHYPACCGEMIYF